MKLPEGTIRAGTHCRPRATPTDNCDHLAARAAVTRGVAGIGELADQIALLDGQPEHMPGAHLDGRGPCRRHRFATRHHDYVAAARQPSACASASRGLVEHYRRGRQPRFPADRHRAVDMDDAHADGRGDPVDLIAQCRLS
jgi:hypothetical protein